MGPPTPPLISILCAAHRPRRAHVEAAIASVLAQTEPRWELIVSDDSADPELADFCARLGDARVRYVAHSEALGAYGNHGAAMELALGAWIAILNQDDVYRPRFLERMLAVAERDGVDVVFSDHEIIDDAGFPLPELSDQTSHRWGRAELQGGLQPSTEALVVAQSIPGMMASIFRAELLRGYQELDAGPAYDVWITALFVRHRARSSYVPERLSAWRTHEASATSQGPLAWSRGAAEVWNWLHVRIEAKSMRRQCLRKSEHAWLFHAGRCLRAGNAREARRALAKAGSRIFSARGLVTILWAYWPGGGSKVFGALARWRSRRDGNANPLRDVR